MQNKKQSFFSLRYGGDCKRRTNLNRRCQPKFRLDHVTLPAPLQIPATFCDILSKTEGVIPEHRNVRYIYYNKMFAQGEGVY